LKLSYKNAKGFGLALLAGFAVNGGAQTYTAIDLGTVSPNSINNALQVAGNNFTTGNAFLYTNGTQVNLGSLAGAGSSAASVNINGQVTGNSRSTPTNGALPHTFLYIGGVMTDLGTLPGGSEQRANHRVVPNRSRKTHACIYLEQWDLHQSRPGAGWIGQPGYGDQRQR
jgi:probable HAF family extracellular repeat protein